MTSQKNQYERAAGIAFILEDEDGALTEAIRGMAAEIDAAAEIVHKASAETEAALNDFFGESKKWSKD